MEFQYFGGNCVRITTKQASIVIDDNLATLGLKTVTKPNDVVLFTTFQLKKASGKQDMIITIDQPGEYEVSSVSIQGVKARAHMDEADAQQTATMYKLTTTDMRVAVVGHIHPDLSDEQLEALGKVDVLIVPVGNSGYTLDPLGALKVIRAIDPKVVIPVHYADKAINYEVPQISLEDALKAMSMEVAETVPRLKLKSSDLPELVRLIVLERQ